MDAHPILHPSDQTLRSYGLGKLDDGSAEAVNKHLEQCPDCRNRVAELSPDTFLGRLRNAQGGPDSPAPIVASLAGLSLVKTRGPLPVANAASYAHQAVLGLQHAHEHGMVHRDIKPGNLMLSRQGNRAVVKVLDFGLAKVSREVPADGALTYEGQMLGTPDFIAPEQRVDARSADIRADIYSLGCTLYYLSVFPRQGPVVPSRRFRTSSVWRG